MKSKVLLSFLFLVPVALRLSKILPNFEFVTTSLVISSLYLSKKHSLKLILAILAITDFILGNTNIFLFTWSGFIIPILIITSLRHYLKTGNHQLFHLVTLLFGIFSNLFFYIWTNFGVWLLDSWGMYPKTLAGLVGCYINGLPFLKTQVESTLIFIPVTLLAIHAVSNLTVFKELRWNSGTVPQL